MNRVLLPGIAGSRCVKWVVRVSLKEEESDSPWNRYYYRVVRVAVDGEIRDATDSYFLKKNSFRNVFCILGF